MFRWLSILCICLLTATRLCGQVVDQEVTHLVGLVSELRQSSVDARRAKWSEVSDQFKKDDKWTMMDEIKCLTPDGECELTDKGVNWFAVNRMLSKCMGYHKSKVLGNFNNGEDPNFDYSLIECSVRSKSSVLYELKARSGKQLFAVVPYDGKNAKLSCRVLREGKEIGTGITAADGNIYVEIPSSIGVKPTDILTIEIVNKARTPQAFVLINHNSRQQ